MFPYLARLKLEHSGKGLGESNVRKKYIALDLGQ